MKKDKTLSSIITNVSRTSGIDEQEVLKVFKSTFKGVNNLIANDAVRVKIPYLGKFKRKKNLIGDGNGKPSND